MSPDERRDEVHEIVAGTRGIFLELFRLVGVHLQRSPVTTTAIYHFRS